MLFFHKMYFLFCNVVSINKTKGSTVPACPSIMCCYKEGDISLTISMIPACPRPYVIL